MRYKLPLAQTRRDQAVAQDRDRSWAIFVWGETRMTNRSTSTARATAKSNSSVTSAVTSAIRRGAAEARRREEQQQRQSRAEEWKQFRKDFLYSQGDLAQALNCARRTVVAVESQEVTQPHPSLLRKFRDLKLEHEARFAAIRRRQQEVA